MSSAGYAGHDVVLSTGSSRAKPFAWSEIDTLPEYPIVCISMRRIVSVALCIHKLFVVASPSTSYAYGKGKF